jgi:hypothetical protein
MSTLSGRVRGGVVGAGDGAGEVSERVRGIAPGGGGGEGKNAAVATVAGNVDHRRAPGVDTALLLLLLLTLLLLLLLGGGRGGIGLRHRSRNAITGSNAFIVCAVFDGALGNGRCITAPAFGGGRTLPSPPSARIRSSHIPSNIAK